MTDQTNDKQSPAGNDEDELLGITHEEATLVNNEGMDKQDRKRNDSKQPASVGGGQHEPSTKRFKADDGSSSERSPAEEAKQSTTDSEETKHAPGLPETGGEEEEEEFDETLYEEDEEDEYGVCSDEGDYSAASGVMRLETEFDEAEDVRFPIWLNIARFLDRDNLKILEESIPELKGCGLRVRAERRTVEQLEIIERCGKRPKKNCDVDPLLQLYSSQCFEAPSIRGVNFGIPGVRRTWSLNAPKTSRNFASLLVWTRTKAFIYGWTSGYFMSDDRKVIFSCSGDPRASDGDAGYIGVAGERSRVKWLAQWFDDIVSWDTMTYGSREDHDMYILTLKI